MLVLVVLPIRHQEDIMKWYPSGVTRTRVKVIGVKFSEILIKGKETYFELARNSSYPSSS